MWSLSFIFLLFSMCLFSTLFPFFAILRNPFKELLDFMYYDHLWCWLCFPTSSLLKWQFQMFVVSQPTTPGTTPKDRLFEVLRESSTRFTSIDEADIAAFSDDTVSKISKAANLNFEYDWSRLWSSSSSSSSSSLCTILYHILTSASTFKCLRNWLLQISSHPGPAQATWNQRIRLSKSNRQVLPVENWESLLDAKLRVSRVCSIYLCIDQAYYTYT